MKLTPESKFLISILVTTVAIIGAAMFFFSRQGETPTIPREALIPSSGAHTKGNPNASVYLVEFSDFLCPACAAFDPIVKKLTQTYKDELLFVFRHYPLAQHPLAKPAAFAAEAAGKQGKFWEMSTLLFENQNKLSDALFLQLAESLSLDLSKFANDMASSEVKTAIDRDLSQAQTFNLRSTPTFFLNGKKLPPPTSFEDFIHTIEQALAKEK